MKRVLIAAALAAFPVAAAAQGGAYLERYSDPSLLKCAALYQIRNDYFDALGLCFSRPGALKLYPNNPRTCRYESSAELPMSERDRLILRRIVAQERALGCPRP